MPTLNTPGLELYYEVDDFTDPWTLPETILLLHGNCESGEAWYAWTPQLARRYRVVRPDMRGFGRSTPMPRDFPWTLDAIIDDYFRVPNLMKHACVAARIGEGKAPGEGNSRSIAKTSNAAIADSGCNPSGWHEFWPKALSKALCLE